MDSGLDVGVMIVEGVDEQYRSEPIPVDGSHVHDLSVQIVDLDDGVAYGSVRVETDIEGFFQEKNLGMEPEMLMAAAKFLKDGVGSGDGLDKFKFIFGDAFKHESTKGTIVAPPNTVGLGIRRLIGAGKGALEPVSEAETIDEKSHAMTPIVPVGLAEV